MLADSGLAGWRLAVQMPTDWRLTGQMLAHKGENWKLAGNRGLRVECSGGWSDRLLLPSVECQHVGKLTVCFPGDGEYFQEIGLLIQKILLCNPKVSPGERQA